MGNCQCSDKEGEPRWRQLDEILAEWRDKPGNVIPVLHKAQELFGYLPRDVQEYVASGLRVPVSEVYGVVTFYSLFTMQPKGRHTISLCMGTACYVKGAQTIMDALKEQLGIGPGETTDDARFTFAVMRCMGACGLAPVMVVDDDIYGRVATDGLAEILEKYQ
jgi:NADH:ubiquinone oxidoreductase subunit E